MGNGINQEIKEQLDRIFEYKSKNEKSLEIINRGYCFAEIEFKKLLFVGINPSYLEGYENNSFSYDSQKAVIEYPRYFKKFTSLIENTVYENLWTYLDIFHFRETNQEKVNHLIDNDLDFIISQLKLTHNIINQLNPEIIIVCNSGASNFFGINKLFDIKKNEETNIWLGYDFEFDEDYGIDIIKGINKNSLVKDLDYSNLIGKPILFTSTLTYQDKFNKKRLNWIINRIGKKLQ